MIAEQYRNIKPHFAEGKISPLAFRWRCILLDQDTEYPPFEPCRYFVVNVFAETRDQVIDCLGEEYPWCDIMVADKALGLASDDDYLQCWLEYYDNTNQTPIKEAPHKKEKEKTFVVRERADVIFEYIVEAMDTQEAADKVFHGQCTSHNTKWIEHEILEAVETNYADSK
jgi:hypothetical protein